MKSASEMRGPHGHYIQDKSSGELVKSFIPHALPVEPPLRLERMYDVMEKANQALGRLDGFSALLPNTRLFIYLYVRKEAVLSSQIEGTQSSFSDLLMHENKAIPGVPLDDVTEVSNYVAAMEYGLSQLADGMPISNRLIREIHQILLSVGRGSDKMPGEFRRSQNWVGGTRPGNALYVPPPPDVVPNCMSDLERFIHDQPVRTPVLLKAALCHHQFETIHPFLDGNGRVGRLLITLLLCAEKAVSQPILYLSLFFKANRDEYYGHLQNVRETGDWESWIEFFFRGVLETAQQATEAAKTIFDMTTAHRELINKSAGRGAASVNQMFDLLLRKAVVSTPVATHSLGLSKPTVIAALEKLCELGIVSEITGKERGRLYSYHDYLSILERGTEPLPR